MHRRSVSARRLPAPIGQIAAARDFIEATAMMA